MVAIDIEMPSCCECCFAFEESDYGDWCKLTAKDVKNKDVRLDNCPLIEIPMIYQTNSTTLPS